MPTPLLELDHVRKEFRVGSGLLRHTVTALEDISYSLPEGASVVHAIVGESGSGKSTLARLVMGLIRPSAGRILYRGRPVGDWLKRDALTFRREVQMIFQDPYSTYNPFYRVDRILYSTARKFKLAANRDEADHLVVESMQSMGLRPEYLLGRFPHQLSGGERQRLMLCRILMMKPRIVVADEPVSMLDASLRAVFLDNMLELQQALGMSCLYITHDMNIAHHVADSIMILTHGQIAEQGATHTIFREPLHPYTRLLVSSMPTPDPDRRWKDKVDFRAAGLEELKPKRGYKFALRCPHVMDICRRTTPPLIERSGRDVACYLYGGTDGKPGNAGQPEEPVRGATSSPERARNGGGSETVDE